MISSDFMNLKGPTCLNPDLLKFILYANFLIES